MLDFWQSVDYQASRRTDSKLAFGLDPHCFDRKACANLEGSLTPINGVLAFLHRVPAREPWE